MATAFIPVDADGGCGTPHTCNETQNLIIIGAKHPTRVVTYHRPSQSKGCATTPTRRHGFRHQAHSPKSVCCLGAYLLLSKISLPLARRLASATSATSRGVGLYPADPSKVSDPSATPSDLGPSSGGSSDGRVSCVSDPPGSSHIETAWSVHMSDELDDSDGSDRYLDQASLKSTRQYPRQALSALCRG